MRRSVIAVSGLALVTAVALGLVLWPRPAIAPSSGNGAWRIETPEQQGLDSGKVADAVQAIHERNLNIHSLTVVRRGATVLDAYFYPYDGSTPHDMASVTKSVTTSLIGIAVDQGKLRLDDRALSFFPDRTIANREDRKERITVGDLASMSSGLQCIEANDEQTLREMSDSPDWVQFTLDLPMAAEPGTTYAYCSPGMHLLSAILTKATGMSELEFARRYLFAPLSIQDAGWTPDPQGFTRGWGDLRLYPRDAAKLGQLWLNHGRWEGQQVVSRAWVDDSVRLHARMPASKTEDYGYGWRIQRNSEFGEYDATGRGGQRIIVLPALEAVLVTTGGGFEPSEATNLLRPVVVDPEKPLPANPASVARLHEILAALARPPAANAVPPLPEIATTISGRRFVFEPNSAGLGSFQLDFSSPAAPTISLTLSNGQTSANLPIGLDGVFRITPGTFGYPVGQRGYWADSSTFVFERDEIANNSALLLKMRFAGGSVFIDGGDRTRETPLRLAAHMDRSG